MDEVGATPRLPVIGPGERDFWRRAVAAERERLELAGHTGPADGVAGLH